VGGPGLAFETWVFRPRLICEEKPRSQKRDLGHPLKVRRPQVDFRLLHMVVRRLAGNDDIVDVTLAQSGIGNPNKSGFLL
jgi:hypothetical protein